MAKAKKKKIPPMPSKYPDISARFKEFKEETGLTFDDLEEILGIRKQTISSYCTTRVSPSFHALRMLKQKFGLSYDWLIDGEKGGVEIDDALKKLDEIAKTLKLLRAKSR